MKQRINPFDAVPWPAFDPAEFDRRPFPLRALPAELRSDVLGIAAYARLSVDAPALLALASIGAAAGNRVTVRVGDETHPVNIWVLALLPTGAGKTPMLERISAPFRAAQATLRREAAGAELGRSVDLRAARSRRRALDRGLASLLNADGRGSAEVETLRAQLIALEGVIESLGTGHQPTLVCEDTSVPALVRTLERENGSLTVLSSEASSLFRSVAGAVASEPLEPLLHAFSAEPIHVHRVARPPISIETPALSLLLATQPTVATHLLRASTFDGRGLWERFLFCAPAASARAVPVNAAEGASPTGGRLETIIARLLDRRAQPSWTLSLSTEARERLKAYCEAIDIRLVVGELEAPYLQGWGRKVRTNTIRLAGLLRLADGDLADTIIQDRHVEGAIAVMQACVSHARHVLGVADDPTDSQAVVDWSRAHTDATIRLRDLRRALHRQFPDSNALRRALEELEVRGLVRLTEEQGAVGRPSVVVEFHPRLRGSGLVSAFRHRIPGEIDIPTP